MSEKRTKKRSEEQQEELLREMFAVALAVLHPKPDIGADDYDRQALMRKILSAVDQVWRKEREIDKRDEQVYGYFDGSPWSVVASALCSEDAHPHSVGGELMVAFACAMVAAEAASTAESALDAEPMSDHCAGLALANVDKP